MKKCTFNDITQTSSDTSAILNTETYIRLTMTDCVFESVVSKKEEGAIMILHTSYILLNNTAFRSADTSTSTPHSSLSQYAYPIRIVDTEERERRRNGESNSESSCSWHHSAILLHNATAILEKDSFTNMNDGSLSVDGESFLLLTDISFGLEADNTIT